MDTGPGLIVEDEPVLGRNMRTFLRRHGYEAGHAESLAVARALDNDVHSDIVLVDHSLPDGTGLSFIEEIRKQDRWTKPVMITAHGGVKLAVFAMKVGAGDYLTKPASLDDIVLLVGKLIERSSIEGSLAYLRARERSDSGVDKIIGTSPPVIDMKRRIQALTSAERAALAGPPVLILGETGSGKELVARALHDDGPRNSSAAAKP